MSNEMVMFNANGPAQLPAHLQGQALGVSAALLATIGAGGNRIGLKGSRFRLNVNGKEEKVFDENYLDVIIVGAVPAISRMYYEGTYNKDEKSKPVCYSADGIAPPLDLPTRQSDKCEICKWNQKGSKVVDGVKMKACAYFQRLVVMLAGDDSGTLYKIDVKAQGLFGESQAAQSKFNLREYTKFIANRGADVAQLVTRLSFDTNESVPKLLFQPFRYITTDEFVQVKEKVGSDEVSDLLKITMATIDLSHETTADEAPAETAAEQVTPAAAVAQTTEKTIQQQAQESAQQPATPAPAPAAEAPKKKYLPVPEKLGEFTVQQYLDQGWTKELLLEHGMIVEAPEPAPKPAAPPAAPKAPAAPPKPAAPPAAPAKPQIETVAMPGKPAPPAAPAKPAAAPQPTSTGIVETSTDAELEGILAELG